MLTKTALLLGSAALAVAQTGTAAPPAPTVSDNKPNVVYAATFDGTEGAGITGYVKFTPNNNGNGTIVNVALNNLPAQSDGGPFLYHVHAHQVVNGNCTSAGAHLDPENRGEMPPCNSADKASCQVGDLAGKYGKMTASPWQVQYTDYFLSNVPSSPAFYGDKSVVIHDANTTRIACVNIMMISASGTNGTYGSNSTTAGSAMPTGGSSSGSGSSGSGSSGSGSGSSGSGSSNGGSSSATGTPPKPTSSVSTSGAATGKVMTTGAVLLAAMAFFL